MMLLLIPQTEASVPPLSLCRRTVRFCCKHGLTVYERQRQHIALMVLLGLSHARGWTSWPWSSEVLPLTSVGLEMKPVPNTLMDWVLTAQHLLGSSPKWKCLWAINPASKYSSLKICALFHSMHVRIPRWSPWYLSDYGRNSRNVASQQQTLKLHSRFISLQFKCPKRAFCR